MLKAYRGKLDGIIVLGPGQIPFGYSTRARTARFYDGNPEMPIIASGGRGHFCANMKETEAERLKQYLLRCGVDGRAIRVEPESSNTYKNFANAKELIYLLQIHELGVVTNAAHMERALELGRRAFREGNIDCNLHPLPVVHDLTGSLSELGTIAYELVVRKLIHALKQL